MARVRLVARLDIKGPNLVKGIHLEGLRVMGDPQDFARRYYEQGADELVYMDIVASLYGRNNLHEIVSRAARDIFIPLTVGGGVRSVNDVRSLLRAGADKIALNTAAIRRPELLSEIASAFGSQCVVASIEAKRQPDGRWEAYTDNGRERTGIDAIEWAERLPGLGAGEILVTSVDREGTRRGFDIDLVKSVAAVSSIPIIASGGMGTVQHMIELCRAVRLEAVAMADVLHYGRTTVADVRRAAILEGIDVDDRAPLAESARPSVNRALPSAGV